MSRIVLTNQKSWFENIKINLEKVGFPVSVEKNDKQSLVVFKKLKVNNCNFYEKDNNWVATSGTFIYKEKLGREALAEFLKDAINKNVQELRKNTIGFYAVAYKIDNYIYVFVDETQLQRFHYYIDGDNYILTNESVHLYKTLKTAINIDAMQCCLHISNFTAKKSAFGRIERLMADEVVKIDTLNDTIVIEKAELNDYSRSFADRDEAVKVIAEKIKAQCEIKKSLFKDFTIYQTGGTDSRLVLATYACKGLSPKLIYMRNNSNNILSTGYKDEQICELIAKKMKYKCDFHDMSSDYFLDYYNTTADEYWRDGDSIGCYGNNKKYKRNILLEVDTEFSDFGYFGEMYRQLKELEEIYNTPFSLNDFVNKLFFTSIEQKQCFLNISLVREFLYDIFLQKAKALNMNISSLTKDDCFKLWSYRRTIVDTSQFLISNIARYSYPVLAQKEIYDLINCVPNEWKKDMFVQMSIIKELSPELLKIPFFSHWRPCIFDEEKMTLVQRENLSLLLKICGILDFHELIVVRRKPII